MISIIVSISKNNVIGGNNTLLWNQSDDLKRFKELTKEHPVIMGQKTFESIGKLLPDRINIIISDNDNFIPPYGAYKAKSIRHSLDIVENYIDMYKKENEKSEIFIIGGGSIYKQLLPLANKLYITRIDAFPDGDTLFPEIGKEWRLIFEEPHEKDDKNQYNYTYEIYDRV